MGDCPMCIPSPSVYIIFEQCGDEKPVVKSMATTEKEAQDKCKSWDSIPKSGFWFYEEYSAKEST